MCRRRSIPKSRILLRSTSCVLSSRSRSDKNREVWARSEGLHNNGVSRTIPIDYTNDGRIEGTTAVPSKATTPGDEEKVKPHVSIGDKIKGQFKVALGGMKHDVNLAQEGEDLKNGDKDRLH